MVSLGSTGIIDAIYKKYLHDENFIIVGSGAGAMAMSKIMINDVCTGEVFNADKNISSGLGFLECCIIDTHFIKRCRFRRLAYAVMMNPSQLGVGLGEDTALIIKNGKDIECRGSGIVIILIDGSKVKQTSHIEVNGNGTGHVENIVICCKTDINFL